MASVISKDPRREEAYVWVSWVTGLLAGTDRCYWAVWYKSHFRAAKVEESKDRKDSLEEWTRDHDAMVTNRAKLLKERGLITRVEEEGEFKLRGRNGWLSGKPDVVGLTRDGRGAEVYDQKSGKRKKKDVWQVLLYMFALPKTWLEAKEVQGFVEYKDGLLPVGPLGVDEVKTIATVLGLVTADVEPEQTQSALECKYCDVAACGARFVGAEGKTDLF